jgi:hypothetical protein
VNPSTLEDNHSVTSGRASRRRLPHGIGDRLAVVRVASFRLTLAARAEAQYRRRQNAATVLRALRLVRVSQAYNPP